MRDHWPDIVKRCRALSREDFGFIVDDAVRKITTVYDAKPPSKRAKRRRAAKRASKRKRA